MMVNVDVNCYTKNPN